MFSSFEFPATLYFELMTLTIEIDLDSITMNWFA